MITGQLTVATDLSTANWTVSITYSFLYKIDSILQVNVVWIFSNHFFHLSIQAIFNLEINFENKMTFQKELNRGG